MSQWSPDPAVDPLFQPLGLLIPLIATQQPGGGPHTAQIWPKKGWNPGTCSGQVHSVHSLISTPGWMPLEGSEPVLCGMDREHSFA